MVISQQEPASFRDPANRVFYADGAVLRGLRGAAVADWQALAETEFFGRMVSQGAIIATAPAAGKDDYADEFDLVLHHERVPFISYPYEWTFSMLRDATLRHLELLRAAVSEKLITKDGSAYNLQWRGTVPTFIDIGSFERLREGEPWAGYRQFCQTMLYPLLLQAHLDVDFQPWLRAQIDGLEPGQMRRLFSGGRRWKAGVFKHVHLHEALQRRLGSVSSQQTGADLRSAGYNTELLVATVRALDKLVHKLQWQPPASHWAGYRETCSYSEADSEAKHTFVDGVLTGLSDLDMVLDLGANDGAYSRLAARHARHVVAVEADHAVTDKLYRQLRSEGEQRILPLVMDLANPSPGIGWRGTERASFDQRAQADVVLALALVHHLAIGRNIPLPQVLDWLAGLGQHVVVEFVEPADPMAQRLLANKPAGMFSDYQLEVFEKLFAQRFVVTRREQLPSGTRTLLAGAPRD